MIIKEQCGIEKNTMVFDCLNWDDFLTKQGQFKLWNFKSHSSTAKDHQFRPVRIKHYAIVETPIGDSLKIRI